MRQIRARIRDKRGVDYTEEQIQELARVRLEKFLDPKGVRSDLLEQFRRRAEIDVPPNYEFADTALFASNNPVVAFVRRLLRPLLKLFFSPTQLVTVLHLQSRINRSSSRPRRPLLRSRPQHGRRDDAHQHRREEHPDARRVGVRAARFNERRARALEAVVQYRLRPWPNARMAPRQGRSRRRHAPSGVDPITGGDSLRTRRRRRRRGRRSGPGFGDVDERRDETDSNERTNGEQPAASDEQRAPSDAAACGERDGDRGAHEPTARDATERPGSVEPPSDSGSDAS